MSSIRRIESKVSDDLRAAFNGRCKKMRQKRDDVLSLLLAYFVDMGEDKRESVYDFCVTDYSVKNRRLVFSVHSMLRLDVRKCLGGRDVSMSRLIAALIAMFCSGQITLNWKWRNKGPRVDFLMYISSKVFKIDGSDRFEQKLEEAMTEHLFDFIAAIPDEEDWEASERYSMPPDLSKAKRNLKIRMKREFFDALQDASIVKLYSVMMLIEGFVSTYVYPRRS